MHVFMNPLSSLNSSASPCRWAWTPGFERWSTGRGRTRRLTCLKTPSSRSTLWCTGTPTHDSSPPASTGLSFRAARAPPPSPSAASSSSSPWAHRMDARSFHRFSHTLLPVPNFPKKDQTTPHSISTNPKSLRLLPILSFHFLFIPQRLVPLPITPFLSSLFSFNLFLHYSDPFCLPFPSHFTVVLQ